MSRVTILLPTLDEEGALGGVLDDIPVEKLKDSGWQHRVLVVDGGSEDSTLSIARQRECEIIEQTVEWGKGSGLRMAFEHFLQSGDEAMVMIDADGTYDPADITRLLAELDSCDLVMGSRLRGDIEPGAMSRVNYLGNHVLTWMAVLLYGEPVSDLCTGAWAFRRSVIERMRLNSVRFEIEAEMFATCAHAGFHFGHVPISYRKRIGEPKLGSARDGASILRKLLIRRFFPIHITNGSA